MTLGAPLGLLALLAVPALVAAYFLRRRQPPRVVSALFLWRTPQRQAEAGPRWSRFSRERSLALELLAVLCATFFLADVRCGEPPRLHHAVIVIDSSFSMNAKGVLERAKTEAARIAREENAGALTLVETGARPALLAGPQVETKRALDALEKWRPSQPAHDFLPAFTLAKELTQTHTLYFLTDGPQEPPPPGVVVRSVGARADNAAFLSAQRRDEGGVAQVTVRVANFSDEQQELVVTFTPEDSEAQTQRVALAAGGNAVLRQSFTTTRALKVTLPPDALDDDGVLTLLPSPLPEVTVAVQSDLDEAAAQAVQRFFAIAPGISRSTDAALTIGGAASNARVRLGATGKLQSFVGPFFAKKSHPLLDDVQLQGVLWTAGDNPPGHALLSAGDVVLLAEEDDGTLHVNVALSRSNVQRTPAWPVLWSNVLRQARQTAPGFPRRHVVAGEDVMVVTTPGARWELRGARAVPLIGSGVLTLPPLSPGEWALHRDGEVFDRLVVLPLDARESDLRTRGPWSVQTTPSTAHDTATSTGPERPWWPVLAMLMLLLLDFALVSSPRREGSVA